MPTLRSIGKSCLAYAYSWSGASHFIAQKSGTAAMPFIAGYHRVIENFDRSKKSTVPSMLISAAMLERHIEWLAKRFAFVSLDEIALHLEAGRPFRRPMAVITFDDGYSDVYYHAYPLLKRKGIPAAVFVVTGLIGTGKPQIFDRCYLMLKLLAKRGLPLAGSISGALHDNGFDAGPIERVGASDEEPFKLMTIALNAFPLYQIDAALASLEARVPLPAGEFDDMAPMTWEMIETMHRSGMTIGSHTASHCLLPSETPENAYMELVNSKQTLEARLRATVNHFAYPDGRFNPAVVQAVNSAGYRFAYGICQFRDRNFPLLSIPRKMLWERSCVNMLGRFSPAIMNCQVDWLFDRKDHCEHDHFARKNGTFV
jgi:peptidoglycan/xylan/chitin deacetylase (PgdA/CDA1 family)